MSTRFEVNQIREKILAATCPYCRAGWDYDPQTWRHTRESKQEAFGSTWDCKSTVRCVRDQKATDAIMSLLRELKVI